MSGVAAGTRGPTTLRFDERVALVTGAGNGLGRAYALGLGARGARVVVNDLGGSLDGSGSGTGPAEAVVAEIQAAGGRAVADTTSVISPEGGEQIIDHALESFGRLDILVNNAGVLDTATFADATDDQIDAALATHLRGAFSVTRPAMRHMVERGGGRIVNTSSGAILGAAAGVAYQAAKAGILGFTRALAVIGAPHGIVANAILPTAHTRMTATVPDRKFGAFMEERFRPEYVAAVVTLLCHESFQHSGEAFLAGGGRMARLFLGVTQGAICEDVSAEGFASRIDDVMQTEGFTIPSDRASEFAAYLPALGFSLDGSLQLTKE